MYFLKTKVIFEGDSEPTIVAQSEIGSVNEIEPVLPDLKLEPGMVVRSREGTAYLVVLEDGSPGRKRLELLPLRDKDTPAGQILRPFFPFRLQPEFNGIDKDQLNLNSRPATTIRSVGRWMLFEF